MLVVNENHIKGLNMVIKAVSRKFNFIVGWEIENLKYEHTLFINILVDLKKVLEYYNQPPDLELDPYYKKNGASLVQSVFKDTVSSFSKDKEAWDKQFSERYKERKEIVDGINNLYLQIPETFQLLNNEYKIPVIINIEVFKFV